MLKNTFCHIPGISVNAELKLWSAGLCSWDCLDAAGINAVSSRQRALIQTHLKESQQRLTAGDVGYYHRNLKPAVRAACDTLEIARQMLVELYMGLCIQPQGP
jgi:hypothetical protein